MLLQFERTFTPEPCCFCTKKDAKTWVLSLKIGKPFYLCDSCKSTLKTICQLSGIPVADKGLPSLVRSSSH